MNHSQRKHYVTLKRRANYLENRMSECRRTGRLDKVSYDAAEVAALYFAIECVEMCDRAGTITPTTGQHDMCFTLGKESKHE